MTIHPVIIHQSAVAVSHSGDVVETVLATITIPALAANDQVRIGFTCSRPASQAAEAAVLCRFNSNLAQRWRIGTGRGGSIGPEPVITNRNSTSSQLLGVDVSNDGLILTATEDTSVVTTLTLAVVLGDAADALTLEQLTVDLASGGTELAGATLATLATVKARLGITDTTDDTLLTNFLELVSSRFAGHCNRVFGYLDSATHEFAANTAQVMVDRYPLVSVASWHLKDNETDGWVAQTGVNYLIKRGGVIELYAPLGGAQQLGRVTFAGGYVLPGSPVLSGQTALPDAIEHACVEQAAFLYRERHRLGIENLGGQGGSVQSSQLALLPLVKEALQPFIRWNP